VKKRQPSVPRGTPGPFPSSDEEPPAGTWFEIIIEHDPKVPGNFGIKGRGTLPVVELIKDGIRIKFDDGRSTRGIQSAVDWAFEEVYEPKGQHRDNAGLSQQSVKHTDRPITMPPDNAGHQRSTQAKGPIERKRGPNEGTLKLCEIAMRFWLDDVKPLKAAVKQAGTTEKTVERYIPNVLEMQDTKTRARWIARLRALGKSHRLGRFEAVTGG
jgi:hypothetical protein